MLCLFISFLLLRTVAVVRQDLFCLKERDKLEFSFEQFHYQEQVQKLLVSARKSSKDCGVLVRIDYQKQTIKIKFDVGKRVFEKYSKPNWNMKCQ